MKSQFVLFYLLLLFFIPLKAQQWTIYKSGPKINDCKVVVCEDSKVWIATGNGIIVKDSIGNLVDSFNTSNGLLDLLLPTCPYPLIIDRKGNKWFVTKKGIQKYDGKNWVNYLSTNIGYPSNIGSIAIDTAGNPWVASMYGLFYHNGTKWQYIGISAPPISLDIDSKNNVWIGVCQGSVFGLQKFDGKKWVLYDSTDNKRAIGCASCIHIDSKDNIWFMGSLGLTKFDGTNWTSYDSISSFYDFCIDDKNNNIWFQTTDSFLCVFDGIKITKIKKFDSYIFGYNVDQNGYLWIPTMNNGILKYDGNIFYNFKNPTLSSLPYDQIQNISIDKLGRKWVNIGNYHGNSLAVTMYNDTSWTNYYDRNIGSCTAFDSLGYVWCGSQQNLSKFDGISWIKYPVKNLFAICMAFDKNGIMWLGTDHGVFSYSKNVFKQYNFNYILSLVVDNNNNKWFSSANGINLFVESQNSWLSYTELNSGLINNVVKTIAVDTHANVWFGTDVNGLSMFDGTNWYNYNTGNSGLVNDTIYSLAADFIGNIWIGTLNGVSVFDGQTWKSYTRFNSELDAREITAIAIDAQGKKWFGTGSQGIFVLDDTKVGISDYYKFKDLIIYPNPADNKINYNNQCPSVVTIYSLDGKLVFHKNIDNIGTATIDVSLINAGVYLIKVANKNGIYTQKIIKN